MDSRYSTHSLLLPTSECDPKNFGILKSTAAGAEYKLDESFS